MNPKNTRFSRLLCGSHDGPQCGRHAFKYRPTKRNARCCFCLRFVLMVGIVRLLLISTLSRSHAHIVSSLGLCRLRLHHYKHTTLLVKRVIYFRFAGLSLTTGSVERQQNIHRTFICIVLWQDQVSYSEESPVVYVYTLSIPGSDNYAEGSTLT